jgi:hypothetical protein
MKIAQIRGNSADPWIGGEDLKDAHLVLVFGDCNYFQDPACFQRLSEMFPNACIAGCSSAGTVLGSAITDDVVATAIKFANGSARLAVADVTPDTDIRALAAGLMEQLKADDLRHVLVFSDGLAVNGSKLAAGLNGYGVTVTGGLAADGPRFERTWVIGNAPAKSGCVVIVGLYGDVAAKTGSAAGWQEFGAERIVTKSAGNVVTEIDSQPALSLYKRYLGDLAKDLPSSGLRFPLSIRINKHEPSIIRTLLAVDEAAQSLTFAGDVPQGSLCKLMRTEISSLIDSAGSAAEQAKLATDKPILCLMVTCVGRRLVLGQLTEDELAIVATTLGPNATLAGFYSYGELAPFSDVLHCRLHNQTMTLTTIQDKAPC